MNNQQRAHLKQLSGNTLHWALGSRVAITADEWAEALHQAQETQRAVQRLIKAIQEHTNA